MLLSACYFNMKKSQDVTLSSLNHEVSKTPPKYPPTVTYSQLISGIELLEEIMWEYGENNPCGNIPNIVHLEKK